MATEENMTSAFSIYAGTVDDVRPDSGDWIIVDLSISEADAGLTESGAPCCVYRPGGDLHESTFGEAANLIIDAAGEAGPTPQPAHRGAALGGIRQRAQPHPEEHRAQVLSRSQPGAGVALSDGGRPPSERNDPAPAWCPVPRRPAKCASSRALGHSSGRGRQAKRLCLRSGQQCAGGTGSAYGGRKRS